MEVQATCNMVTLDLKGCIFGGVLVQFVTSTLDHLLILFQ